jgi:hypothetical protein
MCSHFEVTRHEVIQGFVPVVPNCFDFGFCSSRLKTFEIQLAHRMSTHDCTSTDSFSSEQGRILKMRPFTKRSTENKQYTICIECCRKAKSSISSSLCDSQTTMAMQVGWCTHSRYHTIVVHVTIEDNKSLSTSTQYILR